MVDLSSLWASREPRGRVLGRTDLVLENESASTVLVVDVICRGDDITVKLGNQTLAVVERRRFTDWLWHGGMLESDDLVLWVEGAATFAVINGGDRYTCPPDSVETLARLVADSG